MDIIVAVNSQVRAAGATYTGSLSISGKGFASVTTSVSLTVTAAPIPNPLTVTNAASNLSGSIAAGELIVAKGTALGPVSPPNGGLFSVNAQGRVDPLLFGVRELFDVIHRTPIYFTAIKMYAIAAKESDKSI